MQRQDTEVGSRRDRTQIATRLSPPILRHDRTVRGAGRLPDLRHRNRHRKAERPRVFDNAAVHLSSMCLLKELSHLSAEASWVLA